MHPTSPRLIVAALVGAMGITLLHPIPASAAVSTVPMTGRISVSTNGLEGTTDVRPDVFVDAKGRFVVFTTNADLLDDSSPLSDRDTNGNEDVYRRDRLTGTTERLSLAEKDIQVAGQSRACSFSADGRYLGFVALATNLPGTANTWQLYRRDIQAGTNTLVSQSTAGVSGSAIADRPCPISDDGKTMAFSSLSKTLVSGDTNDAMDVFVRKLDTNTTFRASVNAAGNQIAGLSTDPALSGDGKVLAFESAAKGIVPGDDSNDLDDVFIRNLTANTTTRASTAAGGGAADGASTNASLSTTGRYVAFESLATNLTGADTNGANRDVFRKDLQTGAVAAASVTNQGETGSGSSSGSDITGDGRYVGFTSTAPDLYPADSGTGEDAFRHDFTTGKTDLVSRQADSIAVGSSFSRKPALSDDGRVAAFTSVATNLVLGDLNGKEDVFVRDFALDIAPFSSALAFIDRQHLDFLGAPAGSLGPNAGKLLTNGAHSPDHSIVLAAHSTEWAGKRAPLTRLYWSFFLRVPDPNGMTYWTNKLTNGTKLSAIASQFAASSEFKTKYGSLSNAAFVTKIYQNIFDRDPDPSGQAYWTTKLDGKQKTRGDVMVSFSESSEGKRFLAPQVDIVLLHLGMLGTMPTTTAIQLLIGNLKGPWVPEVLAATYRQSSAYAARVAP